MPVEFANDRVFFFLGITRREGRVVRLGDVIVSFFVGLNVLGRRDGRFLVR